jgi:Zn-dependent protease/CBS domain-containing protein
MAAHSPEPRLYEGLRLMKIAGIQITIDPSWFIIFLLVMFSLAAGYFPRQFPGQSVSAYWGAGVLATLLFFASILVHELAHALMARRAGIHIAEITLFIFGGVARLSEEARDPKTELAIAIVGPLTSFALALFFWALSHGLTPGQPSLGGAVLSYLTGINVAVGIFNLIPGFPMDGGRVLRAFLWQRSGSLTRATRTASNVGQGFAVVLMVFGALQIFSGSLMGGLWLIFIGMFLRGLARQGYEDVMVRQALAGVPVQDVMIRDVVSVSPHVSVSSLLSEYFLRYGYHGFPVRQNGTVSGVVSLEEVRHVPEDERSMTMVAQIMRPLNESMMIAPQASLMDALTKMVHEGIGRLLVMQDASMRGMLTRTGLLRFLEIRHVLGAQAAEEKTSALQGVSTEHHRTSDDKPWL